MRAEIEHQRALVEPMTSEKGHLGRQVPVLVVPFLGHAVVDMHLQAMGPVAMRDDLLGERPEVEIVFGDLESVVDGRRQMALGEATQIHWSVLCVR